RAIGGTATSAAPAVPDNEEGTGAVSRCGFTAPTPGNERPPDRLRRGSNPSHARIVGYGPVKVNRRPGGRMAGVRKKPVVRIRRSGALLVAALIAFVGTVPLAGVRWALAPILLIP